MKKKNRWLMWLGMTACAAVVIGISFLDRMSGDEYELFVFYFIPIGLAAWYGGRIWGILLAVASSLAWLNSDLIANPTHSFYLTGWDTLMRMCAYILLATATSRIRNDLRKETAMNQDLIKARDEIKQLRGILPMCSFCRKIRDDKQEWVPFERYIQDHSDAQISHGLCPTCYKKHFGEPDGT